MVGGIEGVPSDSHDTPPKFNVEPKNDGFPEGQSPGEFFNFIFRE